MPNYLKVSAILCVLLCGCAQEKRPSAIPIEPSAVITGKVYARDASASFESVSLGGAAMREAEFAHTLNTRKAVDTERLTAFCRDHCESEKICASGRKAASDAKQKPAPVKRKAKSAAGISSNIYSD